MDIDGDIAHPAQQQQQIAEIFTILASLTRDMDSVKHTLEQLVEDGQTNIKTHSGRASSWTDGSRQSSETILSEDDLEKSASLPGLLLSPRLLSPKLNSQRHTPMQAIWLNVGGIRFDTNFGVLERLPQSRLGRLALCTGTQQVLKLADRYDPILGEYYFDRRPTFFADILGLYQTGKLHITTEGCKMAFMEEMVFWQVDEMMMEKCCHQKYLIERENLEGDDEEKDAGPVENFISGPLGQLQKQVWDLFEKPTSSLAAKIVAMFSIFCVVLSTVILTLDTLPFFQELETLGQSYRPFVIIEGCYMGWFTVEFIARALSSPSKLAFMKKFMNIVDFLAILPYFISLAFYSTGLQMPGEEKDGVRTTRRNMTSDDEVRRIGQFFRLLRIIKMFRIVRIFKLAKHSGALKALGKTLRNCYRELGMLFLFLFMGVLIFSSLVYVFENDDPDSSFNTMLDAYWWALITMTTVGFGDVYPITGFGRIIGGVCATFGVLVIALPIPIIGNQFGRYYQMEQRTQKLQQRLGAGVGYGRRAVKPGFKTGVMLSNWSKTSKDNVSKMGQKYN